MGPSAFSFGRATRVFHPIGKRSAELSGGGVGTPADTYAVEFFVGALFGVYDDALTETSNLGTTLMGFASDGSGILSFMRIQFLTSKKKTLL